MTGFEIRFDSSRFFIIIIILCILFVDIDIYSFAVRLRGEHMKMKLDALVAHTICALAVIDFSN